MIRITEKPFFSYQWTNEHIHIIVNAGNGQFRSGSGVQSTLENAFGPNFNIQ